MAASGRGTLSASSSRMAGATRAIMAFRSAVPVKCGMRSSLLDPEVTQEPVERLPVGVVFLPAGEVADVAAVPQLRRPRLGRAQHHVVEPDREEDGPTMLPLRGVGLGHLALHPVTRDRVL